MSTATASLPPTLLERWQAAWPQALAAWSRYTRLHDPCWCESRVEAAREGLDGSFAMIRLTDQSVVIDLEAIHGFGLEDLAVEVLAHEVGHHVLVPATVNDQIRLLARIRRALPTLERHAPMVANLYADLFINDRLQRQCGLRMAEVYRRLWAGAAKDPQRAGQGKLWTLYMGIYEELWRLDKHSLGGPLDDDGLCADAWLGARLVRVYADDWMFAAGRFASLLLPYLLEDKQDTAFAPLHDTRCAAEGGQPSGGLEIEDDEAAGAVHPSHDPKITGSDAPAPATQATPAAQARGQAREPFEYGEILRAAGITLGDHEIAVRYYRQRALPHLVAFPKRPGHESPEPQLEGMDLWELGDPLDAVDWFQSLAASPRPIPGVTLLRRHYGREPATDADPVPVDLDLYVDSSGSMPNPQKQTSWLTLAGAVIALSALRAGARVQVTLWSGRQQEMHTEGFVRDEDAILRILTGYYGGVTAFPIHRLRQTYEKRPLTARAVHILQISDDGITTMFANDERGHSGWDIAAHALASARGGGTMALNLYPGWDDPANVHGYPADLRRARDVQGWDIHTIAAMPDLLAFARAFARRHYAAPATPAAVEEG